MKNRSFAGFSPLVLSCVCYLAVPAASAGPKGVPPGYVDDTAGQVAVDSQGDCVKTSQWSKDVPCREAAKPQSVAEKITLSGTVLFDFDKATLRPEGRSELSKAVTTIKEKLQGYDLDQRQITVLGHTDSVGSDAYNQRLSEARAVSVADFIVEEGVDPRIIRARGLGESEPMAGNETEDGRQQNRRVEIEYQALGRPKG
jgi:outer membrane protein OmpA-like peptidoglycan-associated protein